GGWRTSARWPPSFAPIGWPPGRRRARSVISPPCPAIAVPPRMPAGNVRSSPGLAAFLQLRRCRDVTPAHVTGARIRVAQRTEGQPPDGRWLRRAPVRSPAPGRAWTAAKTRERGPDHGRTGHGAGGARRAGGRLGRPRQADGPRPRPVAGRG